MALARKVEPFFAAVGYALGPYRVAIGFPSTGRRGTRIGECWDAGASGDGTHEILIRPDQAEPLDVAAVLVHELCHVAVGVAAGHGPAFGKCARAIGLQGRLSATTLTPALADTLRPIIAGLGPLPHARLGIGQTTTKKQTTRLLKAECQTCGYTVRVTRKWAEVGAPHCPQHGPMAIEWPEPDADADADEGADEVPGCVTEAPDADGQDAAEKPEAAGLEAVAGDQFDLEDFLKRKR